MLIAREKRKENLAEYILYMWQVEDLLRAFRMDTREVERRLLPSFRVDEATRREIREWYDNLIEMMKREKVVDGGHLQVVRNTMNELSELHLYLLHHGDARYRQLYLAAAGHLQEFRLKSGLPEGTPDAEVALHALYGQLLLRLQKKEIHSQTRQAMETFSNMIAYLAARYRQVEETGEINY
jgi:hypothetical protein